MCIFLFKNFYKNYIFILIYSVIGGKNRILGDCRKFYFKKVSILQLLCIWVKSSIYFVYGLYFKEKFYILNGLGYFFEGKIYSVLRD